MGKDYKMDVGLLCDLCGLTLRPLRLDHQTDRLTIIVDHAPDAGSKGDNVEVDQQSNGNIQ